MLLHLQDRDALLEAFSSAAQTSVALKIATAELPTSPAAIDSPADLKAPAQNGSAAAHHDSVDSAPGVQSAQEADSSSTSGEEDGAEQPAAHQQQHHAGHAASNIVGRAWSSAINGEEVHSAAAAPLPAPQQQRQQQLSQPGGPLQGDFLADLLTSSYTRHAPGTGDMRHDTEGWRCLETSFKVQCPARLAPLPSLCLECCRRLS